MYKTEEEKIKGRNEITYTAAYTILKKMLSEGVINEKVFCRMNEKIAERQECSAFSH